MRPVRSERGYDDSYSSPLRHSPLFRTENTVPCACHAL